MEEGDGIFVSEIHEDKDFEDTNQMVLWNALKLW